jgi:hypothetical protein
MRARTYLLPGAGHADAILLDGFLGLVGAVALVLRIAQVVVRAHVEHVRLAARELKRPAVVFAGAVHEVEVCAGHAADGPVPAVTDPTVQVPRVEALETLEQWYPALQKITDFLSIGFSNNGIMELLNLWL